MQKNLKVVVIDESGQLSVFPKLNKLVRMLTTNMSNKISGNSLKCKENGFLVQDCFHWWHIRSRDKKIRLRLLKTTSSFSWQPHCRSCKEEWEFFFLTPVVQRPQITSNSGLVTIECLKYTGQILAQYWPGFEAWIAQRGGHSPPTNMAGVRFQGPASYVGLVCCWFSPCSERFFFG